MGSSKENILSVVRRGSLWQGRRYQSPRKPLSTQGGQPSIGNESWVGEEGMCPRRRMVWCGQSEAKQSKDVCSPHAG